MDAVIIVLSLGILVTLFMSAAGELVRIWRNLPVVLLSLLIVPSLYAQAPDMPTAKYSSGQAATSPEIGRDDARGPASPAHPGEESGVYGLGSHTPPYSPERPANTLLSDKWLVLAHTGAVGYDLATTELMVRNGWVEVDPLTRPLIGTRPKAARMVPFGALEVAGAAWLAKRYPRVGRWVQIAAIAAHVAAASHNLTLGRR